MPVWNDRLEILITILPIIGAWFSLRSILDTREDLYWLGVTKRNGLRRLVARNHLITEYLRMAMYIAGMVIGSFYTFDWLSGYGGSNETRMFAIRVTLLLLMALTTGNSIRGWRARRRLLDEIEAHDHWDRKTERRKNQ